MLLERQVCTQPYCYVLQSFPSMHHRTVPATVISTTSTVPPPYNHRQLVANSGAVPFQTALPDWFTCQGICVSAMDGQRKTLATLRKDFSCEELIRLFHAQNTRTITGQGHAQWKTVAQWWSVWHLIYCHTKLPQILHATKQWFQKLEACRVFRNLQKVKWTYRTEVVPTALLSNRHLSQYMPVWSLVEKL